MAKAVARTEFMNNAFPAGPLELKGDFYVTEDEHGEHMIFTADSRGKLCLIMKGESGHNELINLSDKFLLSESQVVKALAVSQNRDGQIHLVFSAQRDAQNDDIFVLRPMKPQRAEWKRNFTAEADFYSGEQMNVQVRQILLVSVQNSNLITSLNVFKGTSNETNKNKEIPKSYPQFHVVLHESARTTEDIWAFTVSIPSRQWKREKAFEFTVNSDLIIDKCVATLNRYRGLMVLSRDPLGDGSEVALRFVGFDPLKDRPILQSIPQKVPDGACRIAAFDNHDGYTDIIIAGRQLNWRSAAQLYSGSKDPYTVINSDNAYLDCKQLAIAQTNSTLSAWSLKQDGLLSYQEYTIPKDGSAPATMTPIILLLNQQSDRFSVFQHPILGKKIFVIDHKSTMKMLEQDHQSLMWEDPADIMIPDSDGMIEFKTHTVEVQITEDATGGMLANHELQLACPSTMELVVNGQTVRTGPQGVKVATDVTGSLTVIMKSEDLAVPPLTISDVSGASKTLVTGPLIVDPASQLWNKVAGLQSLNDLRSLKLPDGGDFVKPNVSDQDLQKSVDALKQLSQLRKEVAGSPTVATPSTMDSLSFGDRLWGLWFYIKDKVKQGLEWGLKKLKGAWYFVIEIAGKAWNFILDTAKQVAAAAQKILDVIGDGLDKVKKFFEFIFSWEDILHTKNILVNLTTQGLLWGVDAVGELENQASDFFDDLRKKARALKKQRLPTNMAKVKAGNDPGEREQAKAQSKSNQEEEAALSSPASRYGTYHLNHSGTVKNSGSVDSSPVQRLLERIANISDRIEELMGRCKINIKDLLKSKDITIEDVLQKVGVDLLEDTIALVQSLVVAALGSFADLILALADGINKPIQIPVLTPLYKKLTKGADFTVLDAVCLVLAIPATFMFKIITGKRPKEIEGVESLITLDAMKSELDARMGRVRTEKSIPQQPTSVTMFTFALKEGPTASSNSAPQSGIPEESASRPKRNLTEKQKEAIKFNQTRFAQSSDIAGILLKIVVPTASSIFYSLYSWPRQMIPGEPYHPITAMLSAGAKLVLWIGSFASVASYKWDNVKNANWDISHRWADPQFVHRFRIWLVGGIPIIGALGGKYLGYVFSLFSSIIQSGLLLWLQIESWTEAAGYSVYLAVEEWAKVVGKISSAISGLTSGGAGYGAGIAMFFTQTGCIMQLVRVGLEVSGKREPLQTGMDLVD
jgi:hypothetical protein